MFGDAGAGTGSGTDQALHILRRVDRAAPLVDEEAVIAACAKLGRLVGRCDERHGVVEHAREELLLVAEGVEVRRLVRGLYVAGALVVAVDALVADDGLERR